MCRPRADPRLDERLGERVERDAIPVREAPAAEDRGAIVELVDEGGHEPRLAHAPDAEDREELTGLVAHRPLERAPEERELPFPADHRGVEMPREPGRPGHDLDEADRGDRIGLPLRVHRVDPLHRDRIADERERVLPEQDLAGRSGLLQPCRDVHRVACRDRLVARAGHDLTGVHPDTARQRDPMVAIEIVVQRGECRAHVGCCAHGPQRIVFMDLGNAEDRHDRIADELLDRASVAFDGSLHGHEEALHDVTPRLGVERLAHRRGADDVAEDDRDGLAN